MSQENVEIVRRAWQAPDVDSLFGFYDPAIVWQSHFGPVSGVYHGHEGVRQFFREWTEPLESFHAEAETFIEVGENVVVGIRVSARGEASGVEGEMPQWMAYRVRNGLVIRVDLFEIKREALEAAALSESALD